MRIPTFTARTQRTNDMPGKRFSVRKNAEPFVRAELAKGEVAAALLDSAGEFAMQRREMIAAQQFNEAALRIEEEVAKATNELSKSRDYGNVLDGKNLWGQRMDRIRSEIISTVQLPSLQKKLRHEFDLNEITNRFKLKSVIDQKIIAAEQLSLNSLSTNLVETLSNLGVQNKDYDNGFQNLVNKYAPGIKSGRFNGDEVIKSLGVVKKDIAENVVAQYVGRDPGRAIDLIVTLENYYDGKTDDLQQLQAGGDYTMHTLLNIRSDDANSILEGALNTAKNFAAVIEKEEKKEQEARQAVMSALKSRYEFHTNVSEPGDLFSESDLTAADKAVPEIRSFFARTPDGVLTGAEVRTSIVDYLYRTNEVDAAFQKVIEADQDAITIPYAEKTNPMEYDRLFTQKIEGTLTFDDLKNSKPLLSITDYKYFANGIVADREANERLATGAETKAEQLVNNSINTAIKIAKNKYGYEQYKDDDDELARINKAAFFNVARALEDLRLESFTADAEALTPTIIQNKLAEFFKAEEDLYHDGVMLQYEDYISDRDAKALTNLGHTFSGTKNMVAELDAWFATVEQDEALDRRVSRVKRRLREFIKSGAFE